MTELDKVLARIELRHPAFPVRLASAYDGRVLTVNVVVPNRETGHADGFTHSFPVPAYIADGRSAQPVFAEPGDRELLRWVADRVRAVFIHEFHESFQVDERRMFEPHPDVSDGATADAETRYDFGIGASSPPRSRF